MADDVFVVQPLTRRQREVMREIVHSVRYFRAIGESATQRGIARRLKISHVRLRQHLHELCVKGYLRTPSIEGLHCLHIPD